MTRYWDWLDRGASALGLGGLFNAALAIGSVFGLGQGYALMRLGDFTFSITSAAHQSLDRARDFRWEQVQRLGRSPARQFAGRGDDAITLAGCMLPEFAGGAGYIDGLAAAAGRGEPMLLVDHFGNVFGQYCVLSIGDVHSELDPYGQARKIDFTIAIGWYGEDNESQLTLVDVVEELAGSVRGLF